MPCVARFIGNRLFRPGVQKVLGWFGGRGLEATMAYFTNVHHLPAELAVLPIIAEFLGPKGLFVGFLTRVAAFAIAVDMVGGRCLSGASQIRLFRELVRKTVG